MDSSQESNLIFSFSKFLFKIQKILSQFELATKILIFNAISCLNSILNFAEFV